MAKVENGMVFGKLTVIDANCGYTQTARKRSLSKCECICGIIKNFRTEDLGTGNTTSCGCRGKGRRPEQQHGVKHRINGKTSPTLNSWNSMMARCLHPHHHNYPLYGGRGITVCENGRPSYCFMRIWEIVQRVAHLIG